MSIRPIHFFVPELEPNLLYAFDGSPLSGLGEQSLGGTNKEGTSVKYESSRPSLGNQTTFAIIRAYIHVT